ncbi:unnamed protein product [Dracunculus medinensis]|uniref:DUF1758 domain-containing protein n=1 Tax=Dracunculus medinensis TaxID=318479 RepID=A0A0N4UBV8_DRAME|nr:unnamed protein product [Dracunculus medinensis]
MASASPDFPGPVVYATVLENNRTTSTLENISYSGARVIIRNLSRKMADCWMLDGTSEHLWDFKLSTPFLNIVWISHVCRRKVQGSAISRSVICIPQLYLQLTKDKFYTELHLLAAENAMVIIGEDWNASVGHDAVTR